MDGWIGWMDWKDWSDWIGHTSTIRWVTLPARNSGFDNSGRSQTPGLDGILVFKKMERESSE